MSRQREERRAARRLRELERTLLGTSAERASIVIEERKPPRWSITGSERRLCPPEYQEHLNKIGGLNRYGEPNFKLVWGQTYTDRFYGQMQGGSRGRHEVLMFHDIPAWHLLEWKPPEAFGGPELWFAMTWDKEAHVHALGDYPKRGFYVPCKFRMYVKTIVAGRLIIDAMPLAFWVLDLLVPNILRDRDMTLYQKRIAARELREKESKAWRDKVTDLYLDAQPAFGGQDFDKSANRDRMMKEIQARGFPVSAEAIKSKLGSGHRTRKMPGEFEVKTEV